MRAAVIGAGILGSLTALRLGRAGVDVSLVDDRPAVWGGASLAGEGKVHLGYVYGRSNDASLRILLTAAHEFAPAFDEAVGTALPWHELVAAPFEYLVPPDSLISAADFVRHTERVEHLRSTLGFAESPYLGHAVPSLVARPCGSSDVGHRFTTAERAVDVRRLAAVVAPAIEHHPRISTHFDTRVTGADRVDGRWRLAGVDDPGFDAVVNCAWENAAGLDASAGLSVDEDNLRLRAFLRGTGAGGSKAVTITLGPYGDFVRFPDGRVYGSWYPTGILGFCEATAAPAAWRALDRGPIDDPALVESMIDGLASHVPDIRSTSDVEVQARVVVARGSTDIDDPASQLHDRDVAGVAVHDGWVSVRSPKLTSGPTFARRAAEATLGVLGT